MGSPYFRLMQVESTTPDWLKDPSIPYNGKRPFVPDTGIEPKRIDVDRFVHNVKTQPFVEGHKDPGIRGGYASLTNYLR
jgi:hypothetical protein